MPATGSPYRLVVHSSRSHREVPVGLFTVGPALRREVAIARRATFGAYSDAASRCIRLWRERTLLLDLTVDNGRLRHAAISSTRQRHIPSGALLEVLRALAKDDFDKSPRVSVGRIR